MFYLWSKRDKLCNIYWSSTYVCTYMLQVVQIVIAYSYGGYATINALNKIFMHKLVVVFGAFALNGQIFHNFSNTKLQYYLNSQYITQSSLENIYLVKSKQNRIMSYVDNIAIYIFLIVFGLWMISLILWPIMSCRWQIKLLRALRREKKQSSFSRALVSNESNKLFQLFKSTDGTHEAILR